MGSETGIHDSYDLRDGTPLPVDDVEAARSVVDRTALPAAYWRGGYVFGTTVLLYPRALDPLDPASAEWLVVFSGGWLE